MHHICQHSSLASKTLVKTETKAGGKSSVLIRQCMERLYLSDSPWVRILSV